MNTLSWLIYIADVVTSLKHFATVTLFAATVLGAVFTFFYFMSFLEDVPTVSKLFGKGLIAVGIVFLTIGPIAVLTPTRETVLMIAASEVGERAINSRQVQNVIDPATEYLSEWLQEQTRALRQRAQQAR